MRKENLRVGCCGWGFFNPKKLTGEDWKTRYRSVLQAYASLFNGVEVNSTFYRLPKPSTARKWFEEAREVNAEFEFTVKVHQDITHRLKFGKESVEVFNRVKEIARNLDAKVLVFQTAASFRPTKENISRVENFFNSIDREDFILVWEVRWQDAWTRDIVSDLFSRLDVDQVVDPLRQEIFYARRLHYFRLHGFGSRMYDYRFSDDELERLREIVGSSLKLNLKVYVFFNNYNMYEDALRFMKMMG